MGLPLLFYTSLSNGAIRGSAFLIAEGVVERRGGVVNLVTSAVRPLRLKD